MRSEQKVKAPFIFLYSISKLNEYNFHTNITPILELELDPELKDGTLVEVEEVVGVVGVVGKGVGGGTNVFDKHLLIKN